MMEKAGSCTISKRLMKFGVEVLTSQTKLKIPGRFKKRFVFVFFNQIPDMKNDKMVNKW